MKKNEKPLLFITGGLRSGTTLLDKLFFSEPEFDSFSQPLPLLLVETKRAFLETIKQTKRYPYPLNDQQFSNYYSPQSFIRFLENFRLDESQLISILEAQKYYSGTLFQPKKAQENITKNADLLILDFVVQYLNYHHQKSKKETKVYGWKETFAEEFIPYFLKNEVQVLLIIRDPRDTYASLNYGNHKHTDKPRPLLWFVRQWRKTVSYAMRYKNHSNFTVIKYEEFVHQPTIIMNTMRRKFSLEENQKDYLEKQIFSQKGEIWQGNSSFDEKNTTHANTHSKIRNDAIGKYRTILSKQEIDFIEATCFPEMLSMKYKTNIKSFNIQNIISSSEETTPPVRHDLALYQLTKPRIEEEIQRWQSFEKIPDQRMIEKFFIFSQNFNDYLKAIIEHDKGTEDNILPFTFLVCSERSGSNLITNLLNAHPEVSGPPPSHLFRLFCTNAHLYFPLENDKNWDDLINDFYDAFHAMLGSWNSTINKQELHDISEKRSIQKLLLYIYAKEAQTDNATQSFIKENHTYGFKSDLLQYWPKTKFIIQTRNPLDMAASWVKSSTMPGGVEKAIQIWLNDQTEAFAMYQQLKPIGKALHIKYEDLIKSPKASIKKACHFLEITYSDKILNREIDMRTKRNAKRIKAWANIDKPIMQNNTKKYTSVLTEEECTYIYLRCADLMLEFGYHVRDDIQSMTVENRKEMSNTLKPSDFTKPVEEEINKNEQIIRQRRLKVINRILSRKKEAS